MSNPTESAPTSREERPIETIGQAAAVITKLYTAFDTAAVEFNKEYLAERLAGNEGETWVMFPPPGFLFRRPTPLLDRIVRKQGSILLGAAYTVGNGLANEYRLTKSGLLLPGDKESEFTMNDAVTVHRSGRGFDPGEEYLVTGERVLRAGYDHQPSMPTVGTDGHLAWSSPREWLNNTFREMPEVDDKLLKVIGRLQIYEPQPA